MAASARARPRHRFRAAKTWLEVCGRVPPSALTGLIGVAPWRKQRSPLPEVLVQRADARVPRESVTVRLGGDAVHRRSSEHGASA